jgi:hypothetical protein
MEDISTANKRKRDVRDGTLEAMNSTVEESEPSEKKRAVFRSALDAMPREKLFGFYPHIALRLLPPSAATFDLWLKQQAWKQLDLRQFHVQQGPRPNYVRVSEGDAVALIEYYAKIKYTQETVSKWLTSYCQHARELDLDGCDALVAIDAFVVACCSSPSLHTIRIKTKKMSWAELRRLFKLLADHTTCGLLRIVTALEEKHAFGLDEIVRTVGWKQPICVYVNEEQVSRIPMKHDCSLASREHQVFRICALPMIAFGQTDLKRAEKHLDDHGYNFVLPITEGNEIKSKEQQQAFLLDAYRLMLQSERFVVAERLKYPSQFEGKYELPSPANKSTAFIRTLLDIGSASKVNSELLGVLLKDLYDERDRKFVFELGDLSPDGLKSGDKFEYASDAPEQAPQPIREFMVRVRAFDIHGATTPYSAMTSIGLLDPRGNWLGHVYVWPAIEMERTLWVMGIRASLINLLSREESHVAEKLFAAVALFAWKNQFRCLCVREPFDHMVVLLQSLGFKRMLRVKKFLLELSQDNVRKIVAIAFPFENVVEHPMPVAFSFAAFYDDKTLDDRKRILQALQKDFPEIDLDLLSMWFVQHPLVWRNLKSKDRVEKLALARATRQEFLKTGTLVEL